MRDEAEIAFNFWYYVDEGSDMVYSLAGRAYYLSGPEEEKLRTLKELSKNDYLLAPRHPIPKQFCMAQEGDGAHEFMPAINVRLLGFQLFEELAKHLVSELPTMPEQIDGILFEYRHLIPEGALCLYTALKEREIGDITPVVR